MKIGLDIGYNATKAVTEARRIDFLSVVGTPDQARFSLNGHEEFILTVNGKEWQVGESAVQQSRFITRREDRGWIESDEYLVLFLAALTELTPANWVDLTIVTGLPIKFFADDEAYLQQRLTGEFKAHRKGRSAQTFRSITVKPIPQPFGTVASVGLDNTGKIIDQDLATGKVGIIDIGGKTTNLLSVEKFAEVSQETDSVDRGGWDIVRDVKRYLEQPDVCPKLTPRDHKVAEAIRQRFIKYFGQEIRLEKAIDRIVEPMAADIISSATQLWGEEGAEMNAILITGGGANLIGDHIKRHFRHARIVDNPTFANSVGYWKLSQRIK